jgi:hypothetical protein
MIGNMKIEGEEQTLNDKRILRMQYRRMMIQTDAEKHVLLQSETQILTDQVTAATNKFQTSVKSTQEALVTYI